MAKRARKPNKASEGTERERQLLDQLKEVGSKIGLEVREEKLVREVGYSVHSGRCSVNGRDVILLDRNAGISERTDALISSLAGCDLSEVYLEPEIRRLILSEEGVQAELGDGEELEPEPSEGAQPSAEPGAEEGPADI